MKGPHDLLKLASAVENAGLGGSVGADLRAATNSTWAAAATGDGGHTPGGHLEACIFMSDRGGWKGTLSSWKA